MTQWYYADRNRQRQGPVDAEALRALFRRGALTPDTLVWREGLEQWVALASVADELQLHAPPELPVSAAASAGRDEPASPYAAPASTLSVDDGAVVVGGEVVYAGFWRRAAAWILDLTITNLIGGLVGVVLGMGLGIIAVVSGQENVERMIENWIWVIQLVSFGLTVLYYVGFHSSRGGATPGKMAVGIKVLRSDGTRISIPRAVGRLFATILSSLPLGIGYLLAAFTQRKQTLHDMLCDTLVVDKWAFSTHPEQQKRGLDVVTIVVLSAFGLLLLIGLLVLAVAAAMR